MCVFFPPILAVGLVVWFLPLPLAFVIAWDTALLIALGVMVARFRTPPKTVAGLTLAELTGHPCPACGSTDTLPWMTGRTPIGLLCKACDRRTPGRPS